MSDEQKYGALQLTLEQAQSVVDERSNGGWGYVMANPTLVHIYGEWCLCELEGLSVLLRQHQLERGLTPVGFAESEYIIDNSNVPVKPYGFTVRQAEEFLKNRTSGELEGELKSSKGGRGWFEGHWDLATLEAVCIVLRALTDGWDGAPERIAQWARLNEEEERKEEE